MDPARLPEGIPEHVLLELYVQSGSETLQRLRAAFRRWAADGGDADLADVRRLAHNFRGSSCQLGFDSIARLAAGVEEYTGELIRRQRPGDPAEIDLLESAAGLLAAALEAVAAGEEIPDLNVITGQLEETPR
jgi:chemotaxis protein histidine kinase CheA